MRPLSEWCSIVNIYGAKKKKEEKKSTCKANLATLCYCFMLTFFVPYYFVVFIVLTKIKT